MTEPSKPGRRRRLLLWIVLPLTLLGVAAGIGWSFRTSVGEMAARRAIDIAGLGDDIGFRMAKLEFGGLVLADILIGPDGPRAREAEIVYAAGDLASGRIKSIRLLEPELKLIESEDGRIAVLGLPASLTGGDAPANDADARFPALPDIGRIEIINGHIWIETQDASAVGVVDAEIVRDDDGYLASLTLALADPNGRQATFRATDLAIAYEPESAELAGRIDLFLADAVAAAEAEATLWLQAEAVPAGGFEANVVVSEGRGHFGDQASIARMRGQASVVQGAEGPAQARLNLNLSRLTAPSAKFDFAAVIAEFEGSSGELVVDAIGPSGYVDLSIQAPEGIGPIILELRGEIDADVVAAASDDLDAEGRIRFVSELDVALDSILIDPRPRYVEGTVAATLEMPRLRIGDLAENGSAFGQIDLEIAGGALTTTTPGLAISGVNLPPALLADLPADVRRAFDEPAFVRLGGEGLARTLITVSQRSNGGMAAVGSLGVGVSNPNLAVFVEGDAAIGIDATGAVEHLESENMTVRLVEAAFGPATVSGRVDLAGLSGARSTYTADAKLEASARYAEEGFEVESAELELSGPLEISALQAVLEPRAGGAIVVKGYSGPQFSAPGPLRLTLTDRGARSIVYDRALEELDVALGFRGFKTRAFLNAEDGETGEVDLALGALGVTASDAGAALTLTDASAVIPAYDIALAGADGRIAFGGETAQTGRLTIRRISHLADPPLFRPLSLRVDVTGRGDRLDFEGALIAAGERARLDVKGRHRIASGVGEAAISLPPVVFAPGVLQPQDFVPGIYRTLLETIGEIGAEATVAWNADGLTAETGLIDISIDKLRTSEVTVEQLSGAIALDRLFPPSTDGPQRVRIGAIDIGVPLSSGAIEIDVISPEQVELRVEEFGLFGGLIDSQLIAIDPTQQSIEATLEVAGIDLSSILAFAEFGELSATGQLEGRLPLSYKNGELRINDGLIQTAGGGGELRYRPQAIDTALSEVDRSSELALKAIAHFAYDEISIRINEVDAEELRLDIKISGKSLELFEGVPFEFNVKIEGPIRQIIQESLAPIELPEDVQELLDGGQIIVDEAESAPAPLPDAPPQPEAALPVQ